MQLFSEFSAAPEIKNINIVSKLQFFDIGVNILDDMFNGVYNDKKVHDGDIDSILARSKCFKVSMMCTAGSIDEAIQSLSLCSKFDGLFVTAGIHPTRCSDFSVHDDAINNDIMSRLETVVNEGLLSGKLIALGECGLDYDRLHFCDKEKQLIGFKRQIELASKINLPIFFHNRSTNGDFVKIIKENIHLIPRGGVSHSFTGSKEEMKELIELGLYIGINGCSLKTEENLEVVKEIPIDRLLIETDAPWCGIKASYASYKYVDTQFKTVKKEKYVSKAMIKDRNEPCNIIQILEVIAKIKNEDIITLSQQIISNTETLFGIKLTSTT